jgi:hypothetical protein
MLSLSISAPAQHHAPGRIETLRKKIRRRFAASVLIYVKRRAALWLRAPSVRIRRKPFGALHCIVAAIERLRHEILTLES